jgi:hypothetical protein
MNSDDIGYKRPPKHTQFKKGQSGNPKGRPRKKTGNDFISLIISVLDEKICISEGGQKRSISKKEALIRSLYNKALNGDAKSIALMLQLINKEVTPIEQKRVELHRSDQRQKDLDDTDVKAAERLYRQLIKPD